MKILSISTLLLPSPAIASKRAWPLFESRQERLRVRLNCSKDELLEPREGKEHFSLFRLQARQPRCDVRGTLREIA